MDQNSQKGSLKGYHSLPFAVKVSRRRSFEQFRSLNKRRGSFPHHSIPPCKLNMPFINKVKVFWPRVETRPSYCIFLPFGTPDSGSKFRRYQVFIRYYLASAGMTKGSRLSKRKRNVLFLSNMHYWPSARWSIWLDIWPNSCFCILLDFLKVLYFFFPLFFSWLVMPRDLVARLFAARTHALKLASLLRTYERWICSKSSILFNETKSRPMNIYIGQHDQTIVILIHYAFLLLFSILRVCRPPRHWFISVSRLPFPQPRPQGFSLKKWLGKALGTWVRRSRLTVLTPTPQFEKSRGRRPRCCGQPTHITL